MTALKEEYDSILKADLHRKSPEEDEEEVCVVCVCGFGGWVIPIQGLNEEIIDFSWWHPHFMKTSC